jgi:hypothetical protein
LDTASSFQHKNKSTKVNISGIRFKKIFIVSSNKSGELEANHITDRHDMLHGGYVKENGISLCSECHPKAEYGEFTPNELYTLIGSSYEIAYQASK